MIKHKVNKL